MTAWKLPFAVSGIALPIVAGFYVGGPGLGMAVGALAVAALAQDAALAGALPEVLLIAPCRSNFAERWTSDLEPGRQRAQADLDQCSALLANLGLAVFTRVGDENTVQMTEDTLRGFAATELALVNGKTDAAEALASRLPIQLHQVQPADVQATRPALAQPGVSIQRTIRPLRTS